MKRVTNLLAANPASGGLVLAGLGTALFSCKGILIKLCYQQGVTPDILIALRMIFSFPFYFMIALHSFPKNSPHITTGNLMRVAAFGFMGYYLASLLDIYGLFYITASLERIILYTYPTMVFVLSMIFLGAHFNRRIGICILASYLGLLLVFLNQDSAQLSMSGFSLDANKLHGSLLVLASAFCYSIYLIGTETMTKIIPNRFFTAFAMLSACVVMFVHMAVGIDAEKMLAQSYTVYGLIFVMAVFCTVIPSFLVSAGVQRIGATKAGVVGNIGPLVTLVLGIQVLGESMNAIQLLGFFFVMGGVYFLSQQK